MLRGDYIFSDWIFIFWILYILNIFTFFNPKLLLMIGLCFDIAVIGLMFYYRTNLKKIVIPFIILIFIIKVIPLYTLRNYTIHSRDIYYSYLLFFIYLCWLYKNNISTKKINDTLIEMIIKNKLVIYSLKYYNEYILK
jgi:hypothetical protein